jgi:hypothetical protein
VVKATAGTPEDENVENRPKRGLASLPTPKAMRSGEWKPTILAKDIEIEMPRFQERHQLGKTYLDKVKDGSTCNIRRTTMVI